MRFVLLFAHFSRQVFSNLNLRALQVSQSALFHFIPNALLAVTLPASTLTLLNTCNKSKRELESIADQVALNSSLPQIELLEFYNFVLLLLLLLLLASMPLGCFSMIFKKSHFMQWKGRRASKSVYIYIETELVTK